MRKGFLMVLAVVLVAAMAAPAMADLSASGFVRIKEHVEQNYRTGAAGGAQGGLFILPGKDPATATYVEQRGRFAFDFKSENAGARAFFEVDFANWGDSAYSVGRNQGGGLEGDSINIETKNVYAWFTIPNTPITLTAGLQTQTDSFGGMIFGYADMAGVFVTGKMAPVQYRFGWAKFQEGLSIRDDDVDLYVAEVKFAPVKEARLGLDFYVIRDASGTNAGGAGPSAAQNFFNTNLNTIGRGFADYGFAATNFSYFPATFYYVGVDGAVTAGPVSLSGYGFYNFGEIEFGGGTIGGSPIVAGSSVDVKAFAADLRAELNAGPGKFFVEGAYVSGSGSGDVNDFKAPIVAGNYALAGSFPLTSMDLQILLPNLDDINASAALAYDVQNKGRGIMAGAVGFRMKLNDALAFKVGGGVLSDTKNFVGTNVAGVTIKKHKALEVNANLNYTVVKGMDIGIYGAYAFLSDWEDYGTTATGAPGTAIMTSEADNIYKAMFRMNYAF